MILHVFRKILSLLLILGLYVVAYLCYRYNSEILKSWAILSVLLLASIAIFQEPIKIWWRRPILYFIHRENEPFRRENILIQGTNISVTFERFMVINKGRGPALQCRCQIYEVRKDGKTFGDYRGYPLKWASRPEAIIDQLKGERLNIGPGETEFIDLAHTVSNDTNIHLEKYHSIAIGIPDFISFGNYEVEIIFSGDNFSPYFLLFNIDKENSNDIKRLRVKLKKYWQK